MTAAPEFWTVVETLDSGEPIIAVCRTKSEAEAWANAYDDDPRFYGGPEVRPGEFAGPYSESKP